MDAIKFLADLGKMAEEFQKPMTLETALNLIDPETANNPDRKVPLPDSIAACNAMEIKARMLVVEYARKKLADDNEKKVDI